MPCDTGEEQDNDITSASHGLNSDVTMRSHAKNDPLKCDITLHQSNTSLSNLTVSDPDIATSSSSSGVGSSTGSSRPPSSSGLITPDLPLPTLEDYTTETVDFHTSPQSLKEKSGVCFAEEVSFANDDIRHTYGHDDVTSSYTQDDEHTDSDECGTPVMLSPPSLTIRGDGLEGSSDVEEEYFEEFHLPNTHENAFVRHKSFRRKVKLTPIDAPDAEKIEDLVRAGELYRHGSIRRRITSDHDLPKLDLNYKFREEVESNEEEEGQYTTGTFEKNIREIEHMLNEGHGNSFNDISDVTDINNISSISNGTNCINNSMDKNHGITSTPKSMSVYGDTSNYAIGNLSVSLDSQPHGDTTFDSDNSLSIEQSTLMKIRDCLDVTKYKDMYNLSGKLQDILTPLEVEEVLNNSHRYSEYIDKDVIRALSNSLQEQNGDSGISSKSSTDEHLEQTRKIFSEDGQLSGRRRLLCISRDGMEETSITSNSENLNKKKIKAPMLDFEASNNDDDYFAVMDTSDPMDQLDEDNELQKSPIQDIPKIRIVRSASQYDDAEILVNCSSLTESQLATENTNMNAVRPKDLDCNFTTPLKRISVTDDLLRSPVDEDNISVASALSEHSEELPQELEQPTQKTGTAEVAATHEYEPVPTPPPYIIPELSALEESTEERHWRTIVLGGVWRRIDMKVIAPYRRCVTHGGYTGDSSNAVILISSCYLPDRSRRDYNYVMDNLFLYVVSTLEQLISDDYILIYLASGGHTSSGPGFQWLKKAYQMIDRKLRKNLKSLHVVHSTLWVRTIVALSRPFISAKFYRKLNFVNNLTELAQIIPLDQLEIPDVVKQLDCKKGGGNPPWLSCPSQVSSGRTLS